MPLWRRPDERNNDSGAAVRQRGLAVSKNLSYSRRVACWKWSTFYAIAEFAEFLDHSRGARALGLGAHRWTPFLIADPLVENEPKQSAQSMGGGPDGLLVFQARRA